MTERVRIYNISTMGSSNLITNQHLISDAIGVYEFAKEIAKRSGHIKTDLLLTAVWYCVNHENDSTLNRVSSGPEKNSYQNEVQRKDLKLDHRNDTKSNSTGNKHNITPSALEKSGHKNTVSGMVTQPTKTSCVSGTVTCTVKLPVPVKGKSTQYTPNTPACKASKVVDNDDDIEIIDLDELDDDGLDSSKKSGPETDTVKTNQSKTVGVLLENQAEAPVVSANDNVDMFDMDCEEIDPYEELKDDDKDNVVEEAKTDAAPKEKENVEEECDDDAITIISDFEESDEEQSDKKNTDKPFKCHTTCRKECSQIKTRSSTRSHSESGNHAEKLELVTTDADAVENHGNDGPVSELGVDHNEEPTEDLYNNIDDSETASFTNSPVITNVQSLSEMPQDDMSDKNIFLNDQGTESGVNIAVPVTAYSSRVNKPVQTVTSTSAIHSEGDDYSGYQPMLSGQPGLYMMSDMSQGRDVLPVSNSVPTVFSTAYDPSRLTPQQQMTSAGLATEQLSLHSLHQMTETQQHISTVHGIPNAQHTTSSQQIGDQRMQRPPYLTEGQMTGATHMTGPQQVLGNHHYLAHQMPPAGPQNMVPSHIYTGMGMQQPSQFRMSPMVPPDMQQQPHMYPPTVEQQQQQMHQQQLQQQQQQQKQHSMFQQQYIEQFVQRPQQPTEDSSPPMKRRLLDHDKKWHSGPTFSSEQGKYGSSAQNEYDPRKSSQQGPPHSTGTWHPPTGYMAGADTPPVLVSMEVVDDDRRAAGVYTGHVQPLSLDDVASEKDGSDDGKEKPTTQRGRRKRGRRPLHSRVDQHRKANTDRGSSSSENDTTPTDAAGPVSRGRGWRGRRGSQRTGFIAANMGRGTSDASKHGRGPSTRAGATAESARRFPQDKSPSRGWGRPNKRGRKRR